jgi:hypothetical protein
MKAVILGSGFEKDLGCQEGRAQPVPWCSQVASTCHELFLPASHTDVLPPTVSASLFFFIYSYVHTMFGSFLPPLPSAPSLYPPPSRFQAETVVPFSLILLKREYKE